MSRTKNTIKNFSVAVIGQILGLFVSFIARIFFVRILGNEYLGLNGLFTNILTVLSLAELGVGNAIVYSLYKPLAENDNKSCCMIMQLYQKVYIIIGLLILIVGIAITPLLPFMIKEMPDISEINLIYVLFVINTAISYWFSYKRNLIIADQNRYIATIFRYGFYVLLNIFQIIFLVITKNYIIFLLLQIFATFFENICVSRKANKMYPYLKNKEKIPLDTDTKDEIIKNTKAMMLHKIGGTLVTSTDNILLSSIVGLQAVGLYSNYYMVTYALNLFLAQLYNSLIPSIGNYCVTNDEERKYNLFKKINFLTFYLYAFSAIMLCVLYNLFIEIWIGVEYLFNINVVIILIINFYLSGMRKSVLAFRDAQGLFDKDKWKSIIEATVNVIASIILGVKFGTFGVFLGTFVSSITTCVWVEPYVLYKYGFNKKLKKYFVDYFKKLVWLLIVIFFALSICNLIKCNNIIEFIVKAILTFIVFNISFIITFRKTEEFEYFYEKFVLQILDKIKCLINNRKKV